LLTVLDLASILYGHRYRPNYYPGSYGGIAPGYPGNYGGYGTNFIGSPVYPNVQYGGGGGYGGMKFY
jgi:hypothetical protein